jgi:hypothetical protein
MRDALFEHAKTKGVYTVIAKVTASLPFAVQDMEKVGVREVALGSSIAVTLPNLGLDYQDVTVQGTIENGDDCVLYRGTDGRMWLRRTIEFTDGRFTPLNPRAACMMPPTWHFGAMGVMPIAN